MSWLSCLGRRARRAQRNPTSESTQAPETEMRTGASLAPYAARAI